MVGFPAVTGMNASSFAPGSVPPQFAALFHEMPSPPPVQVTVDAIAGTAVNSGSSIAAIRNKGTISVFFISSFV